MTSSLKCSLGSPIQMLPSRELTAPIYWRESDILTEMRS
jgi:hypothetical protein